MPGGNHKFRQEEKTRDQGQANTLSVPWSRTCLAELGDLGRVLRTAEPNRLVEPSLERWVQFSERVMNRILESSRYRPRAGQRLQTLFDRLMASDSRLKESKWAVLAILFLAVVFVFVFETVQ